MSRAALVVGGGGAIGAAIVRELADAGMRLAIADVAEEAAARVAADVGGVESVVACDVARREQLRELFAAVEGRFGGLDVLVNAAGVPGRGAIESVDEQGWNRVIAVNLSAVFWACAFAVPLLRRRGGGAIVNIASIAGLREQPGSVAYSASKGGVVMLSRTLAADLAGEGIRVHAVCPPAVETPMVTDLFEGLPDPVAARRAYEAGLPAGRLATPEQVARVVRGLACDPHPFSVEPLVV